MNNIKIIQNHVKDLLSTDRKKEAIKYLNKVITFNHLEDSDLANSLVILSNEYFKLRKKEINNILSHEETQKLENSFTYRFLALNEFLESASQNDIKIPKQETLNSSKGIVPVNQQDYSISRLINEVILSDDKIGRYLLVIKEKKIELKKLKGKAELNKINEEIATLEKELSREKIKYNKLNTEYQKIKVELVNAVKPIFSDEHFGNTLQRLHDENEILRNKISNIKDTNPTLRSDPIRTEGGLIFQEANDGHFVVEMSILDFMTSSSVIVPTADSNIKIKIPNTVRTNSILRVKNKGFTYNADGPKGDMYYHINIKKDTLDKTKASQLKKLFEKN